MGYDRVSLIFSRSVGNSERILSFSQLDDHFLSGWGDLLGIQLIFRPGVQYIAHEMSSVDMMRS